MGEHAADPLATQQRALPQLSKPTSLLGELPPLQEDEETRRLDALQSKLESLAGLPCKSGSSSSALTSSSPFLPPPSAPSSSVTSSAMFAAPASAIIVEPTPDDLAEEGGGEEEGADVFEEDILDESISSCDLSASFPMTG
ncbi:MAG: hypothetical protein SGPRY_010996 [Prymnesium sp.]